MLSNGLDQYKNFFKCEWVVFLQKILFVKVILENFVNNPLVFLGDV